MQSTSDYIMEVVNMSQTVVFSSTVLFLVINLLCPQCSMGFAGSKYYPLHANINSLQWVVNRHNCGTAMTKLQSSMTSIIEKRNKNDDEAKKRLKGPSVLFNTLGIFAVGWCLKTFTRRWLAIKAGEKFLRAGLLS